MIPTFSRCTLRTVNRTRSRKLANSCDSMTYVLIAVGWVPNISRKVTSNGHLFGKLDKPSNGMAFHFDPSSRHIIVEQEGNDFPRVKIQLMDESGQCRLLLEKESDRTDSYRLDDMGIFKVRQRLDEIWMTFRGRIDSSTVPDYSLPEDESYATEMARQAVCTAMDHTVLISEIDNLDRWGDVIAERFIQRDETLIDSLKSYPRGHKYWSDPKHFWNRRRVIDRALGLSAESSTNAIYFRSFISIYGDSVSNPDVLKEKLELRNERMSTMSRFVEERMEYISLQWLVRSVGIAVLIGLVSISLNL